MAQNNTDYQNELEYRQVSPAKSYFDNLSSHQKTELERRPSFSSLLKLFLIRIFANLLKFIETTQKIQFSVLVGEPMLPEVSAKTRILIRALMQKKIIKRVTKLSRSYHDEPWIFRYLAETPAEPPDIFLYSDGRGGVMTRGGGADFSSEERALMRAVGEGIERLSLCVYREKNLLLSSFAKISKKALNPLSFASVSVSGNKFTPKLKIDGNSAFRWTKGFSFANKKKLLIPAQLIYIGYKCHPNEPIIRQQLSTGAAAADSFEEALYKGVCEAVERDAFMITYLNKLSPPLIDAETIEEEEIQHLLKLFKRYKLELYLIDITTDITIPSVMAVIIDRTGVGPAVHVAAKTGLNIQQTIKGVIIEAIQGRLGFRDIAFSTREAEERRRILEKDPSQIKTFKDRYLFWASLDSIANINFLLRGPKKKISNDEINKYQNTSNKEKLEIVLHLLEERGIDVYGLDLTLPQIKEEGLYVAKIVSPQLQPLYLDEELKHYSERLFRVPIMLGHKKKLFSEEELNPLPHPFL
jgi:ribosomal protein S12 methylthiotransferase accessory factor